MTAIRHSMRLVKSSYEGAVTDKPWSVEVSATDPWFPLYVTGFHATPRGARREANEWCEQNLGQGK